MVSGNGQEYQYKTYLKVLGTVQDGGSPHIGCQKSCCKDLSLEEKKQRKVTSLELYQSGTDKSLLFEASPDIISQLGIAIPLFIFFELSIYFIDFLNKK